MADLRTYNKKKNKTAYKILVIDKEGKLRSPFMYMEYTVGEVYHSALKPIIKQLSTFSVLTVEDGLHAYTSRIEAFDHRLAISEVLRCEEKTVVVKCIIPTGSKYVVGKDHEIVSDTLQVVKQITL